MSFVLVLLVLLLLAGLPLAVWLDLSNLADTNLRRQARDLNSVISSVRGYYAANVVGRVLASPGTTKVVHNYQEVPGAIPIPATLSLELGRVISEQQQNITYRFVSDYPFKDRPVHALDSFETDALSTLRQNPDQQLAQVSATVFSDQVRLIAPVIMGQACVTCHNSHPESPKTDWKVGDVRGIQEVAIAQPIGNNVFAFKYLLAYFALIATVGTLFIALQRRQAAIINGMNVELETANEFLASLSMKISRYLSPQIYKSIFSGQKDVTISTERKKLTIFFSDIKDFTATTERLQPEQITQLLNEYFTEMSTIALAHGGTVDKFVGDAIWCFSATRRPRVMPKTREPAFASRSRCSIALPTSTPNGAAAGLNTRSASAWASIQVFATSEISAATIAWTTRSSARKRTWPRVCSRSPNPGKSLSATRPTFSSVIPLLPARCRRSR